MASFAVPFVPVNTASWGPPKASSTSDESTSAPKTKFHNLPYAPFGRSDRIGKVADFTQPGFGTQQASGRPGDFRAGRQYDRYRYRDSGAAGDNNEGFQYRADPNEDNFQLVDTTKSAAAGKKFVAPAAKRRQQKSSLRQLNARRGVAQTGLDSARFNQVCFYCIFVFCEIVVVLVNCVHAHRVRPH